MMAENKALAALDGFAAARKPKAESKPKEETKPEINESSKPQTKGADRKTKASPEKRKRPGQPKKDASKKKKQIALTLKPDTIEKLSTKGDDYRKDLSRYIDDHVEEILKGMK